MKDYINTKEEFKNILNESVAETKKLADAYKEIAVYDIVFQQLLFIKKVMLEEKRKPTEQECELIMIGNIAVKNFESDMPNFARKLIELDYYFEFYEELK